MHNRVHCHKKGFLTLLDCINKPFGRIEFLFDKLYRIFLCMRFVFRNFIRLQHFLIIFRHMKRRRISTV